MYNNLLHFNKKMLLYYVTEYRIHFHLFVSVYYDNQSYKFIHIFMHFIDKPHARQTYHITNSSVSEMFSVALLAVCLLFGLLYLWYKNEKRKYADLDKLPGPTPHFFYGNALEFGNNIIGKAKHSIKFIYNLQSFNDKNISTFQEINV